LGEKRLATTVLLDSDGFREPRFYGKRARGIRRHYAWLRRRLGERKLLPVIRRVKDTESRKINTLCHQISRVIVEQARANNAIIAVGDLKGIRQRAKGRRMNRLISSMPNDKLSSQLDYKAAWKGVPVIKINERGTSKTCHRCSSTKTMRVVQSVFQCRSCGLVYNADLNGAMNIAKRAWEHCFQAGAGGSPLLTLPERGLIVNDEERSSPSNQAKR
jgi:IS605 OrfB family transposase